MINNSNQEHTVESLKNKSANEPVANYLGMKLLDLSEGFSRVSMTLRPEHLNFNGLVFGGIIMSIADLAFAYATNCANVPNVAAQFSIQFISGASVGDVLTAECTVIKRGNRACFSEMVVNNQKGKLIAKAMGVTIPINRS